MIILRIFLYLICIISIGWSILVFGGPPIIKKLISGYSDGTLIPSGISVSPGLDVGINRLDFTFRNEVTGDQITGFSRATEIVWSLLGDKPFLKISLGPSVLKDYATVNRINIYTPSIQKIDWQNIAFAANIDTLALNSFAKTHSLTLVGNLNLEAAKISDVNIDAENFSLTDGGSTYSANLLTGRLSELKLNKPIKEQLFSSTFEMEDITVSEFNLTAPEAIVEVVLMEGSRNLKIDLHDARLLGAGSLIKNVKVDGSWSHLNVLQQLQIDFVDGVFVNKSLKFPEISARIKKSGDEQYQANVIGDLEQFDLSDSENFIGLLPRSNFLIDLEIDSAVSKVTSVSKINFNTLSAADIVGIFDIKFTSEFLTKLECELVDCELSDFEMAYEIKIDDEWIKGSANCEKSLCGIQDMDHVVRTSNTANIFTILNQANILNPLSSLYLYGAISSGRKINGGHELKFQF